MPRITMIAVQLCLVVGTALLLIRIGSKLHQSADLRIEVPPSAQPEKAHAVSQARGSDFTRYRFIAQRNLFHSLSGDPADPQEIDISELKPTDLRLKLWGTITGPKAAQRAVIEDAAQHRQVILREQESVAAAKIKKILRDKVILVVNGENQILEMEKPASSGRLPAARRMASPAPSVASLPDSPNAQTPRPALRIRLRPELRNQLAKASEDWSAFATVSAVEDEEGNSGLLINRLTGSSPLRRLGIRNGDFVIGISGEPVTSLNDLGAHFQDADSEDEITMQFKRRGILRDITYSAN